MRSATIIIPGVERMGSFDPEAAARFAAEHLGEEEILWEPSHAVELGMVSVSHEFNVGNLDPTLTIEPVGTSSNRATPWHIDTMSDEKPASVFFGSTEFSPDIVTGQLTIPQPLVEAHGPAALIMFLAKDEGQDAVNGALEDERLELDTSTQPGDIFKIPKFGIHRRKSRANTKPRLTIKDVEWEL